MTTTRYGTCMLCEAACGITVEVDEGRILKIRGDALDPMSRGYICPKAVALEDIHADPDRLRTPMRRDGDRWQAVGWDEALDEIAQRLHAIQTAHGKDAVALYLGNPTVHSYGAMLASLGLMKALSTKNIFSANSVDGLPRLLTSYLVFGSPLVVPIPDIDRTDFFLIVGANPVVSNGSLMTAPDCKRRLQAIRARGGKVVVVDPRRTETASIADQHLFIVPGTDAMLLAALVSTVFEEKLASAGRIAEHVDGLDRIPGLLAAFTAERVAPVVGIAANDIRELARAFCAAQSAVCYGRMGTSTQEFGALSSWLIDVLNLVTGNLDRPGGAMFPTPAADLPALSLKLAAGEGFIGFDRHRSRVRGLPEFNGELPVAALAEEIDTPGPGQIRALVTHAGNPVLSCPNGGRIERALGKLDFMVSVDLYRNETTRHANFILPTTFGLEHDHYSLVFHTLAVRNSVKYTRALVPPPPGLRDDAEVLAGIATRLVGRRGLSGSLVGKLLRGIGHRVHPRELIRWAVRFGPYGNGLRPWKKGLTLDEIERHEHGIDLGELRPRIPGLLGRRRIQIAPAPMVSDLTRLEARLTSAITVGREDPDALLLVGRRHLRSNNSWMHNSLRLVRGKNRCTLLVHPVDAEARSLSNGDCARVRSRVGAIEAEVEVSDEMMAGVVSLPHGWGHGRRGAKLGVADSHAGVSVNDVTDETVVDPVSGCASLTAVRVTVERVARDVAFSSRTADA